MLTCRAGGGFGTKQDAPWAACSSAGLGLGLRGEERAEVTMAEVLRRRARMARAGEGHAGRSHWLGTAHGCGGPSELGRW